MVFLLLHTYIYWTDGADKITLALLLQAFYSKTTQFLKSLSFDNVHLIKILDTFYKKGAKRTKNQQRWGKPTPMISWYKRIQPFLLVRNQENELLSIKSFDRLAD